MTSRGRRRRTRRGEKIEKKKMKRRRGERYGGELGLDGVALARIVGANVGDELRHLITRCNIGHEVSEIRARPRLEHVQHPTRQSEQRAWRRGTALSQGHRSALDLHQLEGARLVALDEGAHNVEWR